MAYTEKRGTDEKSGPYVHWEPDQLADSFRCWLLSLLTMPMGQSSEHLYVGALVRRSTCTSQHLYVGALVRRSRRVAKIVCHTQTGSDKWFHLQYDIPRYQKPQFSCGVIRFGNGPDDQAEMMEEFERTSEEKKLVREHC